MYLLIYEISRIETRMYLTLYFSPMKKTLRVLVTLSILASSTLFAQSASAVPNPYSNGNGNIACISNGEEVGHFIVENFVVVDDYYCNGTANIPSGVTSIGANAFYQGQLSAVTIPNTVTRIEDRAFAYSRALTSVVIPNSVTYLGEGAFIEANSLSSVTLPNGITTILSRTFQGTFQNVSSNSTSITIPNSVTVIEANAFNGASNLHTVIIPDSVTEIQHDAFANGLYRRTVVIGEGVWFIDEHAFENNSALTSLTIGSNVSLIRSNAFNASNSLTSYTYCGSLTAEQLSNVGLGGKTNTCAPTTATVSAGEIPNSQVATFPMGVTEAVIPATAALPAVKLNFSGAAPEAVTLVPVSENPAPVSVTPFRVTGSTKIVDIQITGSFNGSATVCLDGSATDSLFHFTNDAWVELASRTYDAITGQVCGVTTSFSPFTAAPANTNPSAPGSVIATATGKRSATVSFTAPTDDGGAAITSYTVISTPGGLTQTLTQATGGTFTFATLQPSTAYTFSVTATNSVGTSAATTSNSVTTVALDVASISSLSFTDNGSGTGGKLVWAGRNIESVLYTGPATSYPGSYSFGAFSSSWNGSIGNLIPATSYTISIYAISADGLGASKSLTFTTAAKKEEVKDLKYWKAWVEENTFTPGEASSIIRLLTNFDALKTSSRSSFLNLPKSRVLTVTAKSLTPDSCSLVSPTAKTNAGLVTALTKNTCTISYTITGRSKAPVTLVKDFVFKKVS